VLSVVHLGELGLNDRFLGALRRRVEESDFVNLCKLVSWFIISTMLSTMPD
jgi:hypothetical protein